jgi:hypothetical protein
MPIQRELTIQEAFPNLKSRVKQKDHRVILGPPVASATSRRICGFGALVNGCEGLAKEMQADLMNIIACFVLEM